MALSGDPVATAFICFWTKADKIGFWPRVVCPLMTQSGHPARHRSQAAAPPSLHGSAQSHVRLWLLAKAIETECPIWNSAPCFCLIAKAFSLACLLASAMLVPALAQTNPPPASPAPAAESTAPKAHGEMWRSSRLIGLNVYNDQDEKLGAISILITRS